jgi:tetratricopeptide (TPR) repeat protein
MLCLMFRPERDAPIWQLREHAARYLPHRYTEINLQPLTSEAARELASGLLGTTQLPDSVNALLDRAAGTPLWLEELIRTLQERGVVTPGEQAVADLEHLEIPDTLHGLIVARLDRLGEARVALQTASVIGRQFAHRVLSRIAEDAVLDEHLVQAQRADLVRELAVIPEREYGFKHVLVQEATYSTLLLRRRRELHRLVAEALTELYADRLETLRPMLAFHYERAEEWEKALEHTMAAAEAARTAFANREALSHFSGAIELLPRVSQPAELRMRLLRRRAEVTKDLGDFDAARADLESARALAAELNDAVMEAQIVGSLAMLWSGHRDYEEGLRLAETAVQIASHANAPRELAQAHVRVATALLNLNREASSRDHLESALGIFRSLRDEDGEAQTLDLLGMVSFVFGHTQAALEFSEEAMVRLRATGDRWTEASSAIVHGISAAFLGDLNTGLESIQYALKAWTEMDSISGISFAHSCIAEVAEPFGEFQLALDHATEGLHIAQSIEHLEWQCMGYWQLGRLYRACGLIDDSERNLREHIRVATSLQATLWISMGYSELGVTLSQTEKLEEGSSLLRRALELGSGIDMGTFPASIEIARLALERGEFQQAYDLAEHVMSNARGLEVWGLEVARVAGLALSGLGRSDDGIELLQSILQRATGWQVQPARWRLHLALSRVFAGVGPAHESRQEAGKALDLLQLTASKIIDQRLRDGLLGSAAMQEALQLSEGTKRTPGT